VGKEKDKRLMKENPNSGGVGMFSSGFVALIGRPNVGKSTLMNTLIGQKTAIISEKPQTTRNQIRGILTTPDYQVIFLDTPGIHKPQHKLGERMVKIAVRTLDQVDLILFLADAAAGLGGGDEYILKMLAKAATPVILVVNKIDQVSTEQEKEMIATYETLFPFHKAVAISALTGKNKECLLELILPHLTEGPRYYPEDMVTDQPEWFVTAELIREKILRLTREEVPHAVAVEITDMKSRQDRNLVDIQANIYVERDSQKGIIIGKGGAMLREIGSLARQDIEALLGSQVFLELRVKVKHDWRNKEGTWQAFGLAPE
jgi:GTP-binding protein Era